MVDAAKPRHLTYRGQVWLDMFRGWAVALKGELILK